MISNNKQKLREYALNSGDFSRERKLPVEHVVGLVVYMAAHRNGDGHDITAQNYFAGLGQYLGDTDITPVTRQAVSQARAKLDWEAFRHLLREANQDDELASRGLCYRGHVTRAIDGTQLVLPHSEDILELFERRKTTRGTGHYPYALLVTALNVFTGQCRAARLANYTASEREQLMAMLDLEFRPGDLSLLDRGFAGEEVFASFGDHGQYYLCRMRTCEKNSARYVREFVRSGKRDQTISVCVKRPDGSETEIQIRLLRGPEDRDGNPVILATNLIDRSRYGRKSLVKLYGRRWEIETLYGRVKNLLNLEHFHAKSVNGILQEIFANLLVLSLTALVMLAAGRKLRLDPDQAVPSFKNASSVIRRHLFEAILSRRRLTRQRSRQIAKALIREAAQVIWKKQPGRRYPRISKQPIQHWNLSKSKKLREYRKSGAWA